jgi:hypothetical protein
LGYLLHLFVVFLSFPLSEIVIYPISSHDEKAYNIFVGRSERKISLDRPRTPSLADSDTTEYSNSINLKYLGMKDNV